MSFSTHFLEADESSERYLIHNEYYAATEVITSYIFRDLLYPLLSTMETSFRETIEASQLNSYAHIISTFEEKETAPTLTPISNFDGWESTRARISRREQNCFTEMRNQYSSSLSLTTTVVGQEREARLMLISFWNRGVQVLFSVFAQNVKFSHILETLSQMATVAKVSRDACGIDDS